MKRYIFFFIPALFLLLSSNVSAAEYTYTETGISYKITTAAVNASIIVTKTDTASYQDTASIWKTYNQGNNSYTDKLPGFNENVFFPLNSNGTSKTFFVQGLQPNTTYYLDVGTSLQKSFKTEPYTYNPSNSITLFSFKFTPKGSAVEASGRMNPLQTPPQGLDAWLEYSSLGSFTTDTNQTPEGTKMVKSLKSLDGVAGGINDDGTFYFFLPNIDPVTYWYRLYFKASSTLIGTPTVGKFDGKTGFIPSISEQQDDFEKRSYRLLAPLPGLAVLLDPDLCMELIREGKVSPNNRICTAEDPSGLSGFINYAVKLLIGLAAVFLVIRIIFEGYQYIVTDVPFLKASAKSKLWEAVGGLVVALSAYLLLNTINPKLVANKISLQSIQLGIEDYGDFNAPTLLTSTDQLPSGVYCPQSGKQASVEQVARSWTGKVVYFLNGSKKDGTAPHRGKSPMALSDGKARLDCSGFVNTVLYCAGYTAGTDYINSGTANIFNDNDPKVEKTSPDKITNTTINGVPLKPGDLLGWKGSPYGHVIIYIGNGKVMESVRKDTNPTAPIDLEAYALKEKINRIRRISS